MKNINYLFLATFLLSFLACDSEEGTITVTYQEATAVYGDLNDIRTSAINSESKTLENPGKIFIGTDFILIGEEEKGIHVVDNQDIKNPIFSNFINVPGNREFFVKGNMLYAESYYDVLKIDISDPNNATMVSRAENVIQQPLTNSDGASLLGFSFKEVTTEVDGSSNLYAEILDQGVVYRDFAQNIIPKSAVPTSFAGNSNAQSGTVNRITHSANHLFIISNRSLHILKDDLGAFEKINEGTELLFDTGLETIFPYQDKLFMGSRSAMDIYDISNPAQPRPVFNFSHATSCDPVLPTDGAAYITLRTGDFEDCPGNTNGLIVLDITDLNNPKEVDEIDLNSPFGMTKIGNKLYIGEGQNGLTIFDISNKLKPELIKNDGSIVAYDVIQHPSLANQLLIAGENAISQYQINENLDLLLESNISF